MEGLGRAAGEEVRRATATIVLAMPFDLVRQDLLMSLEPLKRARIEEIVYELFLPLTAA